MVEQLQCYQPLAEKQLKLPGPDWEVFAASAEVTIDWNGEKLETPLPRHLLYVRCAPRDERGFLRRSEAISGLISLRQSSPSIHP